MATAKLQVYQCSLCGNMVEVIHANAGTLTCCGQAMNLLPEQTADSATEKHVPVVEEIDGGYKVTVGSTLHPMVDDHFIEWIELVVDGKAYRQFLTPNGQPVAEFQVAKGAGVYAREFCNLHGLWKG